MTIYRFTRAGIRRLGLAAVLGLIVVWLAAGAFAQAPLAPGTETANPDEVGWTADAHLGLCQCIADHTKLRRTCMASAKLCEAACASALYSFMPLTHNALSICPPKELYVVLPNADGRPGSGAITVSGESTNATLDRSYAAAADVAGGQPASVPVSSSEMGAIFAQAIGARPELPHRFIIHFALGSARPGAESTADYQALLKDIKARPVYEIEVAGYADTVSSEAVNQKLSLDRANAVAAALTRDGIDRGTITIGGYGKHVLAIPTADDVPELRNRRVEVWVR